MHIACRLETRSCALPPGGIIEKEAGHTTVVTALRNVSFELKSDDAIGLVGHNGAGKSTLLRMLASIYLPVQGWVER